jgi:hypothetical protein
MNFTTLSISIGVVIFCLSFNIMNSLSNDVNSINSLSGVSNQTVMRQINAPISYSDTGISADPAQVNSSKYLNAINPSTSGSGGGLYGYTGIALGALVFDAILKSSIYLGSFLCYLLGVTTTTSTAYYLIQFISWGINLNHIFVIIQLVIRPMGYEL